MWNVETMRGQGEKTRLRCRECLKKSCLGKTHTIEQRIALLVKKVENEPYNTEWANKQINKHYGSLLEKDIMESLICGITPENAELKHER